MTILLDKSTDIDKQTRSSKEASDLEYANDLTTEQENIILKRKVAELEDQLEHDTLLSNLYNKPAHQKSLDAHIEKGEAFGYIFIDLNNFGLVNKEVAHDVADKILKDFSDVLVNAFRRETDELDFLSQEGDDPIIRGRLGGDEFGLLVDLAKNNRRGEDIYEKMDKIYNYLNNLCLDFVAARPELDELGFGVAIGPAVWNPDSPVDARTLYRQAEEAMKESKSEAEEEIETRISRSLGDAALTKSS